MKLSVAMATHNGERYLAEQLRSFADQARRPDQLVVCDDQSTDETLDIVRAFGQQVDFEVVAIRNVERLGVVRNFSKAIDHCAGDIIFLSDQDDVWSPDKLRRHEEIYREDEAGEICLVFNNATLVDLDLKPLGGTTFDKFAINDEIFEALGSDRAFAALLREEYVTGCTLSFRSGMWKHLPEASQAMLHDRWLATAASLLGRIRPIRETLNAYRQHDEQVTRSDEVSRSHKKSTRQAGLEFRGIQASSILHLIEKLNDKGVDFPYGDYREYAIGYLSHLWRRVSLPKSLSRRLPLVFVEFALGNYSRYNGNLRNALSLDVRPKFFRDQDR